MYWIQSYDLSRVIFLVVDENEHMRALINDVLRTLGVETVLTAKDGKSAIKLTRSGQLPDIIVTGLATVPMSGIDFVKTVRSGETAIDPTTPVIMMTAYTERRYVQKARDAGIDEFVAKPFSTKSLYTKIVSIIQHRRPIIRAPEFFGPDRRRHKEEINNRHRRHGEENELEANELDDDALTDGDEESPEADGDDRVDEEIAASAEPEEESSDSQPGFRTRKASSEPLDN